MAIDPTSMTPEELELHIVTELALQNEIEEMITDLRAANYRTKTEKAAKAAALQEKRQELNTHLGLS